MAAPLQQASCAARTAMLVDAIRLAPARRNELVELLAEKSPIYDGVSTREAEHLRGYVLASFERVGLPDEALPFVLEELATGIDPYPVAAAVRALCGANGVPDTAIRLLSKAIARIAGNDDYVQYESFGAGNTDSYVRTTALVDMLRSISTLGHRAAALRDALEGMAERPDAYSPDALSAIDEARRAVSKPPASRSCCSDPEPRAPDAPVIRPERIELGNVILQDQSGALFLFREFFDDRPSVITFFYTRCMNPEKCSLTISKLTRLQRLIRNEGLRDSVNVAAFTYDPAFDGPERLHAYGHARGMVYDDRNKLIRTSGPFRPVQEQFNLGVGFGPSTVNRHRIELLVVDASGHVRETFVRVQWQESDVLRSLRNIA